MSPENKRTLTKLAEWPHGIWRVEVAVRIRELRHRLDVVRAKTPHAQPLGAKAVECCLTVAEEASRRPKRRDMGQVRSWWTGSAMTTAWESVHEAELTLLPLEDPEDVRTSLPRLRDWIGRAMEAGKLRRDYERVLDAEAKKRGAPLDMTAIQQAFRAVIVANRERYAVLRAFRNALIGVTAILAMLIAGLAVWHFVNPEVLTLCSESADCLGGDESRRGDVALVALIGAAGGLLAIAFGLSENAANPSRFDPRAWQVLLKPVAGAATALIAILLIQADILLGTADSRSEAMLLSYAAIFGFSQQLLTRFVDKRAGALIGVEEDADKDGESATT